MIESQIVQADKSQSPRAIPWLALTTSVAASALALLLTWVCSSLGDPRTLASQMLFVSRLVLLGIALGAAASAVIRLPQSAMVTGTAAVTTAIASWGIDAEWDTLRLLLGIMTYVGAAATVILLLPRALQKAIVSLLVLFHFGGIFAAVTSVPPPGASPPWLIMQAWTRVYRPYLQFMYLTNAYHFYSPEPGPATLLWFHIQYSDHSSRWIKVPDRKHDATDPLLLRYYRRLPLVQNVNSSSALQALPPEVTYRRAAAVVSHKIPGPQEIAARLPGVLQYQPAVGNTARLLESYANHIAAAYPHENPAVHIQGIKIYRVVHSIIHPGQLVLGMDPRDRSLYLPYFQGEFGADGKLKNAEDPYLYWLIPIIRATPEHALAATGEKPRSRRVIFDPETELRDYLSVHAGSFPWEEDQ